MADPELPRVLILIDGLHVGGMERQIVELLTELRRSGRWEIIVAVLDAGGEWESEVARLAHRLLPLRRSVRFDLTFPWRLIRQIRRERIDLIHAWGWMSALGGLVAARFCGVPIVNGSIRNAPSRLTWQERMSGWTAARCDLVVANSQAGLTAYKLERHPRTRVITNGVNPARFCGVAPEPYAGPAVCMVGNFSQAKDHPTLLRAWTAVLRRVPDAMLVLVGGDHGTLSENRRLVAELGVGASVRLVTDTRHPEPLMAGSRLCVLTSTQGEGTSNALLEAMALGKPVVATDCPGNAALIQDGITGYLTQNGDAQALAERIVQLLGDPALARSLGVAGKMRVLDRYSSAVMAAAYEDAYRTVFVGRKKGSFRGQDPSVDRGEDGGQQVAQNSEPIRVLMLSNMYPHPQDESFGTFVAEQVRALRTAGVEVDPLFINGRASRWNYLWGFPRLWGRLLRRRYDLIHAHYVFSGWIARAQFGLPIVQSFHAPGQMHTYQGWLCRRLVHRVDEVIVTSADHQARLGFAGAHVIPCGVDFDLFRPRPRAECRATLGWPAGRDVLLWLGDPRREKRLDLAYETFELLRPECPNLDLRVVNRVPHEQVPVYLNAADILLLTSDHEGSPVVVKEAMACNLAVVSTPVGDVPELFEGATGYLLAEQSPREMAAKVKQVLQSRQPVQGRDAIRHLSTAEEARRIIDLYRAILTRKGVRKATSGGVRAAADRPR